ncbi:hypothetical protein ColTof4_13604 [Colletotrichum tofieldiae]|nr:hypothetical protein ColTof3_14556 [Colletotrichum tofieldiae]GKT81181.1 hypothetical protein ColTof4_13604 [Colletotrichum tofieldiae]
MHRDAAQDEVHASLGQHPYRPQDPHQQQQKGQQEEGFSPTRRPVCDVVRRLYSMKHPHQPPPLLRAAAFPLASSHPELFEYLGLDRTAAPCHPASKIATTGPAHKKCRGAIAEAWLARVDKARNLKETSSATAGISATWPGEDSPAKLMQVARMRDSVIQGMSGPGDQWVDEVGLIHAVASTLLDDNSRAEYVNHILPVLRPSPQSWGSLWASTETLCPQPEGLNL